MGVLTLAAVVLLSGMMASRAVEGGRARWHADKGWEDLRDGKLASAVGGFNRALQLRSGLHPALRGLGESYFTLFERQPDPVLLEKAEANYLEALRVVPTDLDSLVRLWHLRALRAGGEEGQVAEALVKAAAVAARRPMDPGLQLAFLDLARETASGRGRGAGMPDDAEARLLVVQSANSLLARRPESFGEIVSLLDPAVLGPGGVSRAVAGSRAAQRSLVEHLLEQGIWENWGRQILDAAEAAGEWDIFPVAASALNSQRRGEEAVAVLLGHLELSPADAESHFTLAGISAGAGGRGWELAREHYGKAVALTPGSGIYRSRYGAQLLKHGAPREAAEQLEEARKLQGEDPHLSFMLGEAYERLGEFDEARKNYRRAVTLAPANGKYRQALERVLRNG